MKTKDIYNKPKIEVINVITEGVIAGSFRTNDENTLGTPARSKRNFWGEE